MKGIVKLQLIDKKTNEVVHEQKNENYITDFYKNFIKTLFDNQLFSKDRFYLSSFFRWTRGLYLLNDSQPSSGKEFLSTTDTVIGYADEEVYSGDDVLRGSYNELESGWVNPRKLRVVWDFGTNVAVGTIRALARVNSDFVPYIPMEDFSVNYSGYSGDSVANSYSSISGTGTFNSLVSLCKDYALVNAAHLDYNNSDNLPSETYDTDYTDLYLLKLSYSEEISLSRLYMNYLGVNTDFNIKIPLNISEAIPTGYNRSRKPFIDDNYIYILHYQAEVGFKIHRYNINTGLFEDEITYNFTYSLSPNYFAIDSDYIVYANGDDVVFVERDTLTETIITDVSYGTILDLSFNELGDKILAVGSAADTKKTNMPMIIIDKTTKTIDKVFIVKNTNDNSYANDGPRFAAGYYRNAGALEFVGYTRRVTDYYNRRDYIQREMTYGIYCPNIPLITINNLTTPITKGADQALKVIYDFII